MSTTSLASATESLAHWQTAIMPQLGKKMVGITYFRIFALFVMYAYRKIYSRILSLAHWSYRGIY